MIKSISTNTLSKSIGLLFASVLMISAVHAQDSNIYDFRVIQLAGEQVYLTADNQLETDDMPETADTLYIFRESLFVGVMNVIAVNPPRIVASFQDNSFSLTRGEFITVKWNTSYSGDQIAELINDSTGVETDGASIMNQEGTRQRRAVQKKSTEVNGRILTSANLTESNTRWSRVLSKSDTRWSSVPSTNLSLSVQQLPGNWDINLNGRYSYRLQTDSRINKTSQLNLYNLNAIKTWEGSPLEIQVGRFHNRYEMNYSYWDGALIQLESKNLGGGVSAGLEPQKSNEGIQTDFPKLGGFFHYQMRGDNIRYRGGMSMTSIMPTGTSKQFNAGLEQRFDYRGLSLDGELQMDRDPQNNIMKLTRLRLRTALQITRWLRLRTNYQKRTPYSYQYGDGIFFSTREQYGVNFTLKFGNWWLNNGISINNRSNRRSTTYDSRIQWYRSPIWDLSWSLHGSYWDSDTGSTWNSGLSASKTLNGFRTTLGTTFYQVNLLDSDQLTGGFFFNSTKTINESLSMSIRLQSLISELMHRNSISVSLWKTF